MPKTDKRLDAIINEIECHTLADIGCDHGKVAVNAILTGKAKKAIATDISAISLRKAQTLAAEFNINEKINFVVGDGLSPIKSNPDCIVIAGLGGNEIVNILEKRFINAKYILVPHQDAAILRKYLMHKEFYIHKDYVIKEGKQFYDIIVTTKGQSNYTNKVLFTGLNKPMSKDFLEKLHVRHQKLEKIINKVKDKNKLSNEIKAEWEEINNALENIRNNKNY